MQTYLTAEDLWGVVSGAETRGWSSIVWKKKNAAALRAIKMSCCVSIDHCVADISIAKDAWGWEELIKIFRLQEGQTESEESG